MRTRTSSSLKASGGGGRREYFNLFDGNNRILRDSYLMRAVLGVSRCSPLDDDGGLGDRATEEEDGGRVEERRDGGRTEEEEGGEVWPGGFLLRRRRRRDLTPVWGWPRLRLLRRPAALPEGPVQVLLRAGSGLETKITSEIKLISPKNVY
ncbi:hypothetical protein EYF80_015813 [Liparis tanakae]|uniref:Uncharacterized protein n=1 Tax=Liparis tanakae TaxID=230148 RepID=A0A4Z2I9B7_9TELE|nr:hypothetical protein EYF80_015813 [Liparis tanakae]